MLIRSVEIFLRRHEMPATKFGRLAAQDPRFVLDLRMGREPRQLMETRVRAFMNGFETARELRLPSRFPECDATSRRENRDVL